MNLKILLVSVILVVICVVLVVTMKFNSSEQDPSSEETTTVEKTTSNIETQSYTKEQTDTRSSTQKSVVTSESSAVASNSDYKKPFDTSPNPSEYEEKLDNSLVLDSRLRPFVSQMATSMSEAKQDKGKARAVFEKFKVCAEASATQEIFAVRASCAENLRTLSQIYPDEFEKEYAEAENRFPEDVKKALF